MNWFQKLFGSSEKNIIGSSTGSMPSFFSTNSSTVNNKRLLTSYKRWVYVCVDRIAQATADVPINLMRNTADGVEKVEDHEALALLNKPNDLQTGRMLRYIIAAHTEISGNAYIYRKEEDQIIPLIPDRVKINTSSDGFTIESYELRKDGREKKIPKDEILHHRYPNPTDIKSGLGVVEPIAKWIDVDTLMTDFNKKFFNNGAWLGGIIESEATNEKQLNLIRSGFENAHRGSEKAHRVGVLPQGAEWKPHEMKQKDMEYQEGTKQFRDNILAAFGVPKSILGFTEDSNRATAETSNFVFQEHTVKPKVQQFVDFLNEQYLDMFDDDELFFDFEDPVPENREAKVEEYKAALGGQSWLTVNDVREEEGKEPVEGGDEIIKPANTAVVGEADEATQNSVAPQHNRQFKSNQKKKSIDTNDVKEVMSKLSDEKREEELEQRFKEFINRTEPFERDVIKELKEQAEELREETIKNFRNRDKEVEVEDLYDKDQAATNTVDAITPIIEQMSEAEARAAMQSLASIADDFDDSAVRYQRALTESIDKMANTYHDETLSQLQKTLNTGIQEGESQRKLIDRINNQFDDISEYRAERVARTETFNAANRARFEAYRQSGVVKEIRWFTEPGACIFCQPMNGEVISMEQTFFEEGAEIQASTEDGSTRTMSLDYGNVQHPPLHPNCRCYIAPETISV